VAVAGTVAVMSDTTNSAETHAPSAHRAIAERLIDGRSVAGAVTLSPDGGHVAFVVATTDLGENTTRTVVWLDDAPVTAGAYDGSPAFSPDGRYLAFTSRRGEKKGDSTLHVLPIAGPGELRTICTMPDGLGDVTWSPDGRWLAFTSRTRDDRYEAKDESWQSPRKIETFFSRLNGEDWVFDRPQHVYVVAADGTGEPVNLTPGPHQHGGIAWLSDSSGVITTAQRHAGWDRDLAEDLYVVSLPATNDDDPERRVRCLTAHDGVYHSATVSPDGRHVAFVGNATPLTYPQNEHVGILPVAAAGAGAGEILWISAGYDRTFGSMSCAQPPVWEDDGSLLAAVDDRGATHLYRLRADGGAPPEPVILGELTITAYDAAAGTVATTRTTVARPSEVYVDDEARTSVAERFSTDLLDWERFTVATTDGTGEIDCWLMRPADLDAAATCPLLLNVHGGPFAQYGEYFLDEFQMQAAAGFAVLCCNPRGGRGRDTRWGQAINGPAHHEAPGTGWGTVDVDDVLAALDGAIDRFGFIDPDRVGMLGGSYGGYMATWLAAHHGGRFRGICSERAVNNLLTLEHSSDIATMFRVEHGATHLEAPELYAGMSPIALVERIDTPMLLIHSEKDWRCPIAQAEELWIALRLLGKEVDFYRFPGENHELSRSGSPVHRVQRAEIILDWFADKLTPTGSSPSSSPPRSEVQAGVGQR
jgi:dipeptidyl aminopeptidase/acylaminoacyl peptidase